MSVLHRESNLMKLYLYCVGKTEVPLEWHQWCCLSLAASCLADRVWYQKFGHSKLHPNMYIFLVGGSGEGKGVAIDYCMQFAPDDLFVKYGSTTSKNMIDIMSAPTQLVPEPQKIMLVQPELADNVQAGAVADQMVKFMTGAYTAGSKDFDEGTRKHGVHRIPKDYVINWLAGTTDLWLSEVVDLKAMMSGFFGRVAVAPGEYSYAPQDRVHDPTKFLPPDYYQVIEYLKDAFYNLMMIRGQFEMSADAYENEEQWYLTRPEPEEERMKPFWRREQDLILKIAMVLSACQSFDLVIKLAHLLQARDLVAQVRKRLPWVMTAAAGTEAMRRIRWVENFIKSRRGEWVRRAELAQKARNAVNVRASELDMIIDDLVAMELVDIEAKGKRTSWRYTWHQRPRHVEDLSEFVPDLGYVSETDL